MSPSGYPSMKVGLWAQPDPVKPSHGPGVCGHGGPVAASPTVTVQEEGMVWCVIPEVSAGQEARAAFMALAPFSLQCYIFPTRGEGGE